MCFILPHQKVRFFPLPAPFPAFHVGLVFRPLISVRLTHADLGISSYFLSTVHAAVSANTFAIYGTGHVKELTELVPGILNQLGPDSLASLRKLAESYQAIQQGQQRQAPSGEEEDDDDVPDLVENFDVEADAKANLD